MSDEKSEKIASAIHQKRSDDETQLASLLKRVQTVTTLQSKPGPIQWDCMCGGNCTRMSDDVYRLWNTYTSITQTTTDDKQKEELIKRLDGALSYYEEKGTIPWFVHPAIPAVKHFKRSDQWIEEIKEAPKETDSNGHIGETDSNSKHID